MKKKQKKKNLKNPTKKEPVKTTTYLYKTINRKRNTKIRRPDRPINKS